MKQENAYVLIAQWLKKAKKLSFIYSKERIEEVLKEAQSGDYDHLVKTLKNN